MSSETFALYSNYSIYSALLVLTLAMLAFAVDLATLTTAPRATTVPADQADPVMPHRARVPAAARTTTGSGRGPRPEPGVDAARPSLPASATGTVDPAGGDATGTRPWAGIGVSLSWLGLGLMCACIALRGLSASRAPLGNMYEFATVGATFVLLAYCGYGLRRDLRWLGLFVIGPVLLTLGLSVAVFYTEASPLLPALQSSWLIIHVTVATLAIAVFTIAFSVTILYLVQSRLDQLDTARMSGAKASVHQLLPPTAALDRVGYGLHIVAFPLWTFTLIAGAIWAEQAWGTYWGWDPKEVWTLVIWIVYAAYLHARATTGWSQRKAACIALAGYGCILVNYLVVNVYLVGLHSYSGM